MENETDEGSADNKFNIRSESEDFQSRQSSVFDQLTALEKKHEVVRSEWKEVFVEDDEEQIDVKLVNEKENESKSPFKVPNRPAPKRCAPDYQVHPEKWTKYSLSSVDDEDMSEASNAKAAEEFLRSHWDGGSDYETSQKEMKPEFSDGASRKFIMSEYVVGVAKEKINSKEKSDLLNSKIPSSPVQSELLSFNSEQSAETAFDEQTNEKNEKTDHHQEMTTGEKEQTFRVVRKRDRNIRKKDSEND